MKVVVLGGAGDMGCYAVETLVDMPWATEVVVADRDLPRARAFADTCGAKASSFEVDVTAQGSLDRTLAGANYVINCVGPYYRFGVSTLRAAIRNGVDYVDLCDDWEPTLEMLRLDSEARASGVCALLGMGASPGVSNLLAVKACEDLDVVRDLYTGWGLGGTGRSTNERTEKPTAPSAAIIHWLHQLTGQIRILRNGKMVDAQPLEEIRIDYPDIGCGRGWSVGHPEAVTLPRKFPELEQCINVMVGSPFVIEAVRALATLVDSGKINVLEACRRLEAGEFPPFEENASPLDATKLPPLFALATGTRDGVRVRRGVLVMALPPHGMGGSTGVPAAVGLECLHEGDPAPGVFTPEEIIDPEIFFSKIAGRCDPARTGDDLLLVISDPPNEPKS